MLGITLLGITFLGITLLDITFLGITLLDICTITRIIITPEVCIRYFQDVQVNVNRADVQRRSDVRSAHNHKHEYITTCPGGELLTWKLGQLVHLFPVKG